MCQYRNINRFVITIAFRRMLSSRLTLIRLTLIRNPESFGEQGLHLLYRYSCLHLRYTTLQHQLPDTFPALSMLSYRFFTNPIASVIGLMPVYYPRLGTRPVSCYALFKSIAASKLTSWLSLHLNLVFPT
jgi:hypothetical protein